MGTNLSVVLDHLQAGVGELHAMQAAPGSLTPGERVDAVEHVKAGRPRSSTCAPSYTAPTVATVRRSTVPATNAPHHSCECMCSTCEAQGAGYFAQHAALTGDSHAADLLSPAVFVTLASERGRRQRSRRKATDLPGAGQQERSAHGAH